MEVIIVADESAAAKIVADAVEALITTHDSPVLGVATGSSPVPAYQELIRRHHAGLHFDTVTAFLLDEYIGLPADHSQAYRTFIRTHFSDQVGISDDQLHGPDGTATGSEIAAAGRRYEQAISDAGGIDLQILGIGGDGHIGFNEPTSSLASRTRLKTLTERTRTDNARFFDDDLSQVPRHVLTQGIGTILEARHLVLVATGVGKAAPIAAMVEGPLSAMVPASALQLHQHATVVIDELAAAELHHRQYYQHVYAHKPDWQGL